MTGQLDEALIALLRDALPSLFGGATPLVQVDVLPAAFTIDPAAADPEAGQPRTDDGSDLLPFASATPAGPYLLSRPPDASVRRLRLLTAAGDRIPLQDAEVLWDATERRRFTLALRPGRELADVTGVQVLYGVTAVFAALTYTIDVAVTLGSNDGAALERAAALGLAVLALHRGTLATGGAGTEEADGYQARMAIKALHLLGGDAPSANRRRLNLRAEIELKGARALDEGEGQPIVRVRSPGATGDRPIDVVVRVDA